MTPPQKNKLIVPSFVFALLVLLLTGFGAYRQGRRNIGAEQWVRHTYEVLGELTATLSLMQDVETGYRGCVITGEDPYLEPFNNAVQPLPQKVQHLRQLTADNLEQQRRLDALEPLISRGVEIAEKNIAVRKTQGLSAAEHELNKGEGKRTTDEIRRVIEEMEAAENQLLRRRTEELRASNARTLAFFMVLVVVLAGLLMVALFLVRRNSAAQQRELELTAKARAYAENVVDTVPEPLLVLDAELRVQSANRSFYQAFQVTTEETKGQSLYKLGNGQWDIPALRHLLGEIVPQHTSFQDFEVEHDLPDIGRRTFLLNARTLFRVGNNTGSVLLAIEDITERKRAEARIRSLNRVYAVLSDVNQAIVRVRELQALFAEACRIAVEKGGFRMAWIGLLDAEGNHLRPVAHAGVTDGYLDKLPIVLGDGSGALRPAAIALREGRYAVCNDIEHDSDVAAWRDDALARGYRAAAAFPLTAKGKTIGTFALYASEPEFFDAEELRLLDEMAADLAFAMEMGQLEEGQLLLGAAVEQVSLSVIITDDKGRIEYVNPAFAKITGYAPAEVLGKNPRLLKSGKQDRAFYENLWKTIVAGKIWQGEIVNRRKDGSLYTAEASITPVRSEHGQITRFVSIMQDVTVRNQIEEELRQSEERFRQTFEGSPLGILLVGLDYRIFQVNRSFCEMLGYGEQELIGRNPTDLTHPEDAERDAKLSAQILKGEIPHRRWEKRYLRKNGQVFFVELDVTLIRDAAGKPVYALGMVADINERKQAQKAMSETLRFTQQVLDTSPIGIITYKASGEAVGANPAAAQLVGAGVGQVMAQHFRRLESWRQSGLLALAEEALASGGPCHGEFHVTTTFGKKIWVEAHFVPFTYTDEPHLLALFEDITERKRAEESLKLFRVLIDQSNDAIQVVDLETMRLLDVNEKAWSSLGYTREELLSMSVYEIDPTVDEAVRAKVAVGLRKSGFILFETIQRRKDGSTFPVEISMKYVQLNHNYVVCVIRDITERKRAEEALRQAEEKYRGIFEGAVVGIFQSDPSGRYLSANPAMARILGYDSPQELLTSVADIPRQVYVNPEDRQTFQHLIEQREVVQNFECQVYRKDDSKIWVSVNARAVHKDGVLIGFEGTNMDITERKTLEEQLRLTQRLEAVGRLAGGVAHDFNNALGVIIGYSQMLEEAHDWTETQDRQVKEIRKAADRAAAITRQLLAFSRKQILRPRVLNLNAITADLGKMLRRLIGEDVELIMNESADLGRVKADPGQIEQVIMNLAVNARDAMPQGGKLVIETANADLDENYAAGHPVVRPGLYVMLAVSDTGLGMDAETQAQIFEPFFTTKELGKGTGLGLSIVYGIVKQSKGYIWVYSELGQGTTFKIYLPRVDESPDTIAPVRSKADLPGGTETILLVEDEPAMRTMARVFLESKGYTILEAQSGQEAMEIAGQHRGQIHLLLTDVIMPGMSGRELAETLAASRAGMKLLYMSGYTDELVTQQGILNPGLQLLEKPFTKESLLSRIRAVLDGTS